MSYTAYIVPSALLEASPPKGGEWHGTTSPSDATQSLVVVDWYNSNLSAEFEAEAGVVRIGFAWETISADALPLLSLFQDASDPAVDAAVSGSGVAIPITDPPPPQPVSLALRQISWPGARLVR